jgi:hypothetical protein
MTRNHAQRLLMLLALFVALLISACATPAERAKNLYDDGKYEEVIAKYPDEPVAQQARAALAAKLLNDGEIDRVLKEYADTPSVREAKNRKAQQLLDAGQIDEILKNFADTPASIQAREKAAQALYDAGRITECARDFQNTQAGQLARNELARSEFDRAMAHKDKNERIKALEAMLTDPQFAGTDAAVFAQRELAKLSGAKNNVNY